MSREAFRSLIAARLLSDDIYAYIQAFGSRVKDSDTSFGGCFRRTHQGLGGFPSSPSPPCQQGDLDRIIRNETHVDAGNRLPDGPSSTAARTEFCFSVRYPAQHGRNLGDPWVMRRILVYQQYHHCSQDSTWIFLQCPPPVHDKFLDAVSQLHEAHGFPASPLREVQLHFLILSEVFRGWRDYINHLETVIEELVSTASDKEKKLAAFSLAQNCIAQIP